MDLVRLLNAELYLTGPFATWGEGDWSGTPDGGVGTPPAGDGLFDQLDTLAAQRSAVYLNGPYAGQTMVRAPIAVPECSGLIRLLAGLLALLARRHRPRSLGQLRLDTHSMSY